MPLALQRESSRREWLSATILAAAGAGCGRGLAPGASANAVRIGHFGSLTGREAGLGEYGRAGVGLALEELNAAGGVLGRQIEKFDEDIRSAPGESATAVRKLISRDRVVAVISSGTSGQALEAGPFCQQQGVPMICDAATAPEVTALGDCIFRVCFTDPYQGTVMARFARETLRIGRVGFVVDVSSPYSVGLAGYFRKRFEADGGVVVGEQKYSGGDKDFRALLTVLKASKAEALFVPGMYGDVGLILRQARELGFDGTMLGGDGWEAPELVPIAGAAANGGYFPVHFSMASAAPRVQAWIQRATRAFGRPPTGSTALAYDAMMFLADALRRAGTTQPPRLREALAATRDFDGLSGRITMDAERNARKPAVIIKVENGEFKFVQTVEA
jgi:branched-chain amino acid transport system substrate-binding protein